MLRSGRTAGVPAPFLGTIRIVVPAPRVATRRRIERAEREHQEQVTEQNRSRTIADAMENKRPLDAWQARLHREAAAEDAQRRFETQQQGTQTERSPLVEGSGAFAGFATPKNKRKEREERQAREAEAGPGTMLELGSKQRYIL